MELEALNNFVFIKVDEDSGNSNQLWVPDGAKEPPIQGVIISVGDLVQDKKIKKHTGKRCMFHKGTGFNVTYENNEYLVIEGGAVICRL